MDTSLPLACEECGTTLGVEMQPDPFEETVNHDLAEHPLCSGCALDRAQDI